MEEREGGQPRKVEFVGRDGYIATIRHTLLDESGSHILYFVGPGGLGKTSLLKEAHEKLPTWFQDRPYRATRIIDLYHSHYHSPDTLRRAIINALDPERLYFQPYDQKEAEYKKLLKAKAFDKMWRELYEELNAEFAKGYLKLAQDYRIVLILDTLELVQYESDIVLKLCQLEEIDTILKDWLLKYVSQLSNTVVLAAGRPVEQFRQDVEERLAGSETSLRILDVSEFEPHEMRAYLNALIVSYPHLRSRLEGEQVLPLITQLKGGRPIYLSILVDLMHGGSPVMERFLDNQVADVQKAREKIERALIGRLLDQQEGWFSELVNYLVYARKGLDAPLLAAMRGCSEAEAAELLSRLNEYAIIKTPSEDGAVSTFFLHDEIYDLFDKYILPQQVPDLYVRYEDYAQYYRDKLAILERKLSTEPSDELEEEPEDPEQQDPEQKSFTEPSDGSEEEPEDTEQQALEQERLREALLYYELQVDPYVGYKKIYAIWDEEAIKNYDSGRDMRFRDIVLGFINRYVADGAPYPDPRFKDEQQRQKQFMAELHRDCAVRWVKRYVLQGKPEEADQAATRIRESEHPGFLWDSVDDPFYKAALLTAQADALLLIKKSDLSLTEELLREAITLLENVLVHPSDKLHRWWKARILGRAYNDLGYIYRLRGHYSAALTHYLAALSRFRDADIRDERADTLTNLAFVQALLGRLRPAKIHIEDALKLRETSELSYPLALSLNTRGWVQTLSDYPEVGIEDCRTALSICQKLEMPRGVGMASNALGFSLRKWADQWKVDPKLKPDQVVTLFAEAEEHLGTAQRIFEEGEPLRLWQALNELGSLYCDWGWFSRSHRYPAVQVEQQYRRAIAYHEAALEVAKKGFPFQAADSYDDLAQIYSDLGSFYAKQKKWHDAQSNQKTAEAYLQEAEKLVPRHFKLTEGKGFDKTGEPGVAHWLTMGKYHLQWGIWHFRQIGLEKATLSEDERDHRIRHGIEHFALSSAYFQKYSPDAFASDNRRYAFASRLKQHNVSAELAREVVDGLAKLYNIDLTVLQNGIDDLLGF